MKRIFLLTALVATMAIFFATSVASAQSTMRRSYDDLDVDIWTDKDDGSNYYEGDNIIIYFRASRDCFVTIYDLDTRGNINLIFPAEPGDNNFIQGDEIYMIPDQGDDFDFTLEGPPGNETIQIVASTSEYVVPDWRGPRSVYDDDWGFKYDGDNDDFIVRVNRQYFPEEVSAYDNVSFYVAPRYYYQPEKSDCYGDCGQVYIDYPNGCEVFVNGVFYGYAPLYVPSIYLGRHRVTVYWGASIVYNDWIYVDAWNPYFVYTRPLYVYDFCYTNWYRDHRWDRWYDGPSRYKYKDRDFYTYKKPDSRRGYSVVTNTHGKYDKSKVYAEKSSRIEKYKSTYQYDKSTKTYTASKGKYNVDKGKSGSSGKSRDFDVYNNSKKPVYGTDNGTYTKPKAGDTNTGSTSGKGTSRGEVKKPASKGSVGKSGDVRKPATNSGGKSSGDVRKPATRSGSGKSTGTAKQPVRSGNNGKSNGDVKKPATKSDGGKSGNSQPKTVAPSSGGSKSSPSSAGSSSKSGGGSSSKSSGTSGGGSSKSGGNSGGSKRR
ncbi:MAG: DUF4384 domain-containing protein [Candidatus Zixiibacteriota bacterium]